jgi:predicted ATPase
VDFLLTVSRTHPLIIILEDLQWADPSTIDLLSYLADHLADSQILIIGTYRPAELPRQLECEPSLETVLREFKRQFGNIWIDLDHFRPEEEEAFVQALLKTRSQDFDQTFVQRLTRHTGGHPLFVIELLRNIQFLGQPWHSDIDSSEIDWNALPAKVEAVIEMRLASLDNHSCDILKAASVAGEEFLVEVVAPVLGKSDEIVHQTIDTLVKDQTLLIELGTTELSHQPMTPLRFRHSLFQRYVYNNLNKIERKGLHEKVGLALESFYPSIPDKPNDLSFQLANHFSEAGLNIKASNYLLETGNRAVQIGAHAEAIQHFRKGLDLLEMVPKSRDRIKHEISLSLAMVTPLQALKGYADSELALLGRNVRELCCEVDAEDPLLSTLYFLRITHKTAQERQEALHRANQILGESNQTDPLLCSLAHWTLGAEMSYQGDFLSARTHLEQTKKLYKLQEYPWSVFLFGHDPGVASRARLAWVLWFLGYPDQAIQVSQRSLALAKQQGHPVVLGFAIGIGGVLFNQICRDVAAVKAWNLKSIQHSKKEQMQLFNPGEMISRGWVLTQIGQISEGLEMMERGLDAWQQSNATRHYTQYLGMLAEGYSLARQTDKALRILEEGQTIVETSRECYFEAEIHRLTGDTLLKLSNKNDEEAEACFQSAIQVARSQHAKSWELRATNSLCRLWHHQGRLIEAHQQLSSIYNWFSEGYETPDLLEAREILVKIETKS